jgi:hypothetical protein
MITEGVLTTGAKSLKVGPMRGESGAESRQANPQCNADKITDATQHGGFDKELLKDGTASSAEGFTDADLSGPLGDGDQHDIQHADIADDQRDRRDGRGEQSEDVQEVVDGLQPASQRLGFEVALPGSLIRCRSSRIRITSS